MWHSAVETGYVLGLIEYFSARYDLYGIDAVQVFFVAENTLKKFSWLENT